MTDTEVVRKLCLLYSLAGADIIDISADYAVLDAAHKGIDEAKNLATLHPQEYPYFNTPMIMLSVNAGDDPHFKTAVVNPAVCIFCQQCKEACSFEAVKMDQSLQNVNIQAETCYGCGKCVPECPQGAISLKENRGLTEGVLYKCLQLGFSAIEVHVGRCGPDEVCQYTNRLLEFMEKESGREILLSFSVESGLYREKEFINFTEKLVKNVAQKPIIQVDGTPMSADKEVASSLQAIAAANRVLKEDVDAYVILSGGINHHTPRLIRLLEVDCNGIAMGTYARKVVWPYLRRLESVPNFKKAINVATSIVKISKGARVLS